MSTISPTARIHPTAIVEDGAVIGDNCVIGPFCVIGPHVRLGDNGELKSHVVLTGHTTIGKNVRIYPNAVIGGDPQSVHHHGEITTLEIGDNNTIREGVTMNAGTVGGGGITKVGDNNLFLAYSHVAHDCRLGNHIILSNNVLLAGHVQVDDRAILGGGSAVHQFSRIGRQAFVGGLSGVAYDVIPYGAGIPRETIHKVRRAYKEIFEGDEAIRVAAANIREKYLDCPEVIEILDFIAADSDRALSSPNRNNRS
jgi:UDP-N-acetylglucosamine acyltransferase